MVDKEKIRSKIQLIEENIEKLQKIKEYDLEEFSGDFRNIEASKHLLQVNVEAMVDIANHIIARNRWKTPETSAASFRILSDNGYFSSNQLGIFEQMVKFRNRIVHLYFDLDNSEIYKILQNNLGDFQRFIQAIIIKYF